MVVQEQHIMCGIFNTYLEAKKSIDSDFNTMWEDYEGEDCDYKLFYDIHDIITILKYKNNEYLLDTPWAGVVWYTTDNYNIYLVK